MKVNVKPLNWEEDRGFWRAQTNLIACYSVWDCGDHWECSLLDGQFPSAEAAKSAAFADYSARIMSAIEPAGVGVETPPPSSHVAPVEHPIVSADRVYKVLKTYRDHGRFDWDHIGYICRDVAALATTEGSDNG